MILITFPKTVITTIPEVLSVVILVEADEKSFTTIIPDIGRRGIFDPDPG